MKFRDTHESAVPYELMDVPIFAIFGMDVPIFGQIDWRAGKFDSALYNI